MNRRAVLLAAVVLLSSSGLARADVIVLKDGRKVAGVVVEERGEIVVKQKLGEIRFSKDEVLRIERGGDDAYSEAERQKKRLPGADASERYRIGIWLRESGFPEDARAAFESVLALDADHPGARAALGFVREGGRWVSEEDRMRAKGLVKLPDGRWVTAADKIKLEAEARDRLQKKIDENRKREEEREAKRRAKDEAESAARLARIRAYDEELARERARRRAADEAEAGTIEYVVGPYGPYCGWGTYPPRVIAVGPRPSQNDLLAYAAVSRGLYPYPTSARPFVGGTVTLVGGDPCQPAGYGSYGSRTHGTWARSGGAVFGSYTSSNGQFRMGFRFGF